MTRFARAEGSKGSNKRIIEEATTWQEMQTQSIALKETKKHDSKKLKKGKDAVKLDKGKENMLKANTIENVKKQSSFEKNKTLSVKKRKHTDTDLIEEGNKKETSVNKIEKRVDYVVEHGKKYKILKNGQKKPWFELPYQENEVMTLYKKLFVKKEMVQVLDDLRKSLKDEGADSKKVRTTMLLEERKAHTRLRVELLRVQIKTVKEETRISEKSKLKQIKKKMKKEREKIKCSDIDQSNLNNQSDFREKFGETGILEKKKLKQGKKKMKKEREKIKSCDITNNNQSDFGEETLDVVDKRKKYKLEENELMTKFEDYWVLKNRVTKLKFSREAKMKRIMKGRTEPNESALLTPEEKIVFKRMMKKVKTKEHSILLKKMDRLGYDICEDMDAADGGSEDKIKFMGFWIKKSAAGRLDELKVTLEKGGASQEEVLDALKVARRKEERRLKNDKKVYCCNCHQPGHMISDCPKEKKIRPCFTCGSMEHISRMCPEKSFGGPRFSHAICSVCGKNGHIARGCSEKGNSKEQTIDCHARIISSSAGLEDTTEKKDFRIQKPKRITFDD